MVILWYFGGLVPWSDFPSVQWLPSVRRRAIHRRMVEDCPPPATPRSLPAAKYQLMPLKPQPVSKQHKRHRDRIFRSLPLFGTLAKLVCPTGWLAGPRVCPQTFPDCNCIAIYCDERRSIRWNIAWIPGFHEGWGDISSYIPTWLTIQIFSITSTSQYFLVLALWACNIFLYC